jgi:hypothetical protein
VAYKSLKDIYLSQTFGRRVPVLPRQNILREQIDSPVEVSQEPVQSINLSLTDKQESKQPIDTKSSATPRAPFPLNEVKEASWPVTSASVPFSTKEFVSLEGEGNGERKVASLFYPQVTGESDQKYIERLKNFIAGQNDSFDVISDFGNFEVKEFKLAKGGKYKGSVRIGAEGKHTTGTILYQVKELLITLLQLYSSLDEDSKKVINKNLIADIKTNNKIPEYWNLENYIDAIMDVAVGDDRGISEFPKTLFNKEKINPKNFTKNIKRATYLVYTIPQILTALKDLALKNKDNNNLNNEISRVHNLQSTLKGIYLKKEDDKLSREIDKEAEALDRKLISKACVSDKGINCITVNTFLQKLAILNLPEVFANIDSLRQSEVANLFPSIVTGFFAVFETKFKYIPRDKLGSFLVIDSFTQKGLKIALRSEEV